MFALYAVGWGSIPGGVIQKTWKIVHAISLLSMQHFGKEHGSLTHSATLIMIPMIVIAFTGHQVIMIQLITVAFTGHQVIMIQLITVAFTGHQVIMIQLITVAFTGSQVIMIQLITVAFTGFQVISNQGMIYDAWLPATEKQRRRRRSVASAIFKRIMKLTSDRDKI